MARKTSNDNATLAEIAGTTRGLSKLTRAQVQALLDGKAPARPKAEAKAKSEFYEKVIVEGREARQNRQKVNHEAATWMREKGLVPSGQAWAAVKKGERNVKALRSMNEADGLKPMVKKTGVTAEVQAEVKAAKTTTRRTTKAKGEGAVTVTEQHVSVTERDVEAEVKRLIEGGFTDAEARAILG